jgi:hypothetical protein
MRARNFLPLLPFVFGAGAGVGCSAAPPGGDGDVTESSAEALTYSPIGHFHAFGGHSDTDFCLQATDASGGKGFSIEPCAGASWQGYTQGFGVSTDGHIEYRSGYCLTIKTLPVGWSTPGSMDIEPCSATNRNQVWAYQDGTLRGGKIENSSACIDVFAGQAVAGQEVELSSCNGTAAQVWLPSEIMVQISSRAAPSEVLDVHGGDYAGVPLGTRMDVALPNYTWAQYFTFVFPEATVGGGNQAQVQDSSHGACVGWGFGSPYNPAFLTQCAANNDAWFYYSPQRQLVSREFGWCLDDYAAGTSNGNAVDVTPCNGTPAQVWEIAMPQLGHVSPF